VRAEFHGLEPPVSVDFSIPQQMRSNERIPAILLDASLSKKANTWLYVLKPEFRVKSGEK